MEPLPERDLSSTLRDGLEHLLEADRELACVIDSSGRILAQHPRWRAPVGSDGLRDWFVAADAPAVDRAVDATHDSACHEVRARLADSGAEVSLRIAALDPDCRLVTVAATTAAGSGAEAQLRAILEHTPAMVYLKGVDGRFRYVNPDFAQHYGVGNEWLAGRTVRDLFPPDEAAEFEERDRQTLAAGATIRQQIRVPAPEAGGEERVFDALKFPITDVDGSVAALAGIEVDVTERERVSEALARSEARYRRLYERAPMMLHSIDREGRLIGVSGYWLQQLGYREDEVLGRPSTDFLTEASRRYARETVLPEFFRAGVVTNVPYQVVRADGSIIDVLLSGVAEYDETGAIEHSLAVMTDVTRRRQAEAEYRDIFEKTSDGVFRSTPDGRLLQANPALARMHGFDSVDELLSSTGSRGADWYADPRTRAEILRRLERDGWVEAFEAEIQPIRRAGRIWTSESVRATHGADGRLLYYEGTVRDITAQYRARRRTQHRNRLLEMIARNRPVTGTLQELVAIAEEEREGVTAAVFRLQGGRLHGAATATLPRAVAEAVDGQGVEVLGGVFADALHCSREQRAVPLERQAIGKATPAARAAGYTAVTAVPVQDQSGQALGLLAGFAGDAGQLDEDCNDGLRELGQIASIAIEQHRLAAELLHQAQYDTLTDLPNRGLLWDRLEQDIRDAGRGGYQVGVLLLDLDEFKRVNDSLGHKGGDELLRRVAERLDRCLRAGDTVARLGGDEFVVIVPLQHGGDYCTEIAERIVAALGEPITVGEHEIAAHPSIGISVHPDDGRDPETLLQAADTAMYAAKHAGKNCYRYFAEAMNRRVSERLRVESELHHAIRARELMLHLQPRVALDDGRIRGAEALLRWHHPERGLVMPGEFIPVAERSPLIRAIDRAVLEEALQRVAALQAAGHDVVVSINLSTGELHEAGLAGRVADALARARIDPSGLELEITEGMVMRDFERARAQLGELKARAPGLRIAVDDFGSGYSSLNYLRHLPVDTLKIDRSFVGAIDEEGGRAGPIAKTIVDLGRNLDLHVVAEGIETATQHRALAGYGCAEGQGFLFDAALPFEAFRARLAAGPCGGAGSR